MEDVELERRLDEALELADFQPPACLGETYSISIKVTEENAAIIQAEREWLIANGYPDPISGDST